MSLRHTRSKPQMQLPPLRHTIEVQAAVCIYRSFGTIQYGCSKPFSHRQHAGRITVQLTAPPTECAGSKRETYSGYRAGPCQQRETCAGKGKTRRSCWPRAQSGARPRHALHMIDCSSEPHLMHKLCLVGALEVDPENGGGVDK